MNGGWAGRGGWLALAALLCAGPSPAESVVVSRTLCNGLWVVPLTWTGQRGESHELTAVFDTGATELLIDPDGLERVSGRRLREGRRVRMEGVRASDLEFTTFRPRVHEMGHLGAALGLEFDVFLPFPAFDGRLLVLDYPALEMRVEPGALPPPDGRYVFSSNGRDERPWLRVDFPDRSRRILIDSGSNGRLALKRTYGMDWRVEPVPAGVSTRMDRYVLRRAGRVADRVVIGNLAFDQPIVAITRDTELMGVEVLKHFVLTFDSANARVRFDPASTAPVRMTAERGTGALLRADAAGYFEVAHVLPGTPAAAAGLVRGDRILERDGTPVAERGCKSLDEAPRAATTLGVDRDGQIQHLDLELIDIVP